MNRIICLSILAVALWSDRGIAHDPDTGRPNWISDGDYFAADGHYCCGRTNCERLDTKLIQLTPAGTILHAYGDELVPYSHATRVKTIITGPAMRRLSTSLTGRLRAPSDGFFSACRVAIARFGRWA